MDEIVSLSTKGQIVIPKEARTLMDLEPGDKLAVDYTPERIILRKAPESYTDYMLGLHKEVWQDTDPEKYLERERKSWVKE